MTLQTVLRTIRHYKLLSANQTLIIGVSGGTDSLALLHMMVQLQTELDINIHVATLNHGIRGEDAESDVQFVKHIAEEWDIHYTVGQANVPQLALESGIGIENAARQARYDFLADVAQQQGADTVAVAHHADDQAETILMHIVRGSGLRGLRGMSLIAPMPGHSHIALIRPLLGVTREELERYCSENSLKPRHDETNDDLTYQRNYVRHEILPRLTRLNPDVVGALTRLGDIAAVEDDYVTTQLRNKVLSEVKQEPRRWTIDRQLFEKLHETLQRRFLVEAYKRLSAPEFMLDTSQVIRIIDWVQRGQVGTMLRLGGGIRTRMGYDKFYMEDETYPMGVEGYRLIPEDTEIRLPLPTELILNDLRIVVSEKSVADEKLTTLILPQSLELALRTRREGERFQPIGMNGHSRKVKDWMIDRKIPRHLRDRIPMVSADDMIIAICTGDTWHLADLSQYNVNSSRKMYLTLD